MPRLLFLPALLMLLALTLLGLTGCASSDEDKYPTRDWTVEKLFDTGHEALVNKEYEKALGMYQKVEARFPFGVYAQQALLESIYCHYELHDVGLVLATTTSFIKQYPNSPALDYVYYAQGLVNFQEDTGFMAWLAKSNPSELDPRASLEAYQSFKTLTERFPKSPYAKDAAGRMKYLLEVLATYETHVGQLYYNYEAYVASAGRMINALKEYPRSTQQEAHLMLLARSYQALNLPDLLHDTIRVLQKNFPKNPMIAQYLATLKKTPTKPATGAKPANSTKPATPAKPHSPTKPNLPTPASDKKATQTSAWSVPAFASFTLTTNAH